MSKRTPKFVPAAITVRRPRPIGILYLLIGPMAFGVNTMLGVFGADLIGLVFSLYYVPKGWRQLRKPSVALRFTPTGVEGDVTVAWSDVRAVETKRSGSKSYIRHSGGTAVVSLQDLSLQPAYIHDVLAEYAVAYGPDTVDVIFNMSRTFRPELTTDEIAAAYPV